MESAYGPMRFRFVTPSASQGRRKRRRLSEKEARQVAVELPLHNRQARREGRRCAFRWFGMSVAANVTSGA